MQSIHSTESLVIMAANDTTKSAHTNDSTHDLIVSDERPFRFEVQLFPSPRFCALADKGRHGPRW